MGKRKCSRCHDRWSQTNGRCRACQNAIIEEQERIAAETAPSGPAPSYARPGGFGVTTHVPGLVAWSFFGTVFNRR